MVAKKRQFDEKLEYKNMVFELIKGLDAKNSKTVEETLSELVRKSKTKDEVNMLYTVGIFPKLFDLLSCEKYRVPALSILANCSNVDDKWRENFHQEDGISKLVDILSTTTDYSVINRVARLLANLSRNPLCLNSIQTNFIICTLVKSGSTTTNIKCQSSCLRALRMICNSKQAAKVAADCEKFPDLLLLLSSPDPDIMLLCLRLICELLKAQTVEIGYRLVEESVLKKLLELSSHSSEDIRDLIMELLFMLSMNSGCRVAVSMEGGIEIFVKRIRDHENSKSFKYSVQSLCLCAREAVSRNKMKLCGALPLMVTVLRKEEFEMYHESLVAAFVWFLFDDSSLGLLIRAEVTPSLLHYLNRLTAIEYDQRQEFGNYDVQNDSFFEETAASSTALLNGSDTSPLRPIQPPTQQSPPWSYSTPETSPYNANSPQYSIPSYSPNRSPNYSPPASPQSAGSSSPEYDGYCDSLNESCGSSSKNVPYHFQSADGIHAMIHGTRGPIHDTLLLLSRFSQAKNPSSFFLYLPGFNSLLNYMVLTNKPNPKCGRVLNRITLNSHCFDLLLRKKLIPRLYLRLYTGWSLEHLTYLLFTVRNTKGDNEATSENKPGVDPVDKTYCCRIPVSTFTSNVGKLLMSNIRSQCESAYGKGVISNILLAGSKELREICLISLPHIIWSVRLQQRVFVKLRAQKMLLGMLSSSLEKDEESFVLIVEAVCALCRFLGLNVYRRNGIGTVSVAKKDGVNNDELVEPSRKKIKLDVSSAAALINEENVVAFKFSSQNIQRCSQDILRKHSVVFDKMLSPEYVDTKKPFISILDVNEKAFITMVHYLSGCRVRLDDYYDYCDDQCQHLSTVTTASSSIVQNDFDKGFVIENIEDKVDGSLIQKYYCGTLVHERVVEEASIQKDSIFKKECNNDFVTEDLEDEEALVQKNDRGTLVPEKVTTNEGTSIREVSECHGVSISEKLSSNSEDESNEWLFAFDLLSCCERYFIDELKSHCEQYLLDHINSANVVEFYMLSTWHGSDLLAENTLVYLLTMVQCPKLRAEYFMEILQSHEKETFLFKIKTMISDYFDRKVI